MKQNPSNIGTVYLPGLWHTSVPFGTVSRRLVPGAGMETSFSKFDIESTTAHG